VHHFEKTHNPSWVGYGSKSWTHLDPLPKSSLYCLEKMVYTVSDNNNIYRPRLSDLRNPTLLYISISGRGWTPSVICSFLDSEPIIFSKLLLPLYNPQSDRLDFIQKDKIDNGGIFGDRRLYYIHYQIEWRIKLNNYIVAKIRNKI